MGTGRVFEASGRGLIGQAAQGQALMRQAPPTAFRFEFLYMYPLTPNFKIWYFQSC